MSDFERGTARSIPQVGDMSMDVGLRSFMLGVYNKLMLGLVWSAVLAFATSSYQPIASLLYVVSPEGRLLDFTMLGQIVRFAPLLMVVVVMFAGRNMTARSSGIFYWSLVSAIGAGLGVWLLAYTGESVFTTLLITATAFGALSLVGYTTKKDLTGFGSFLIMGLVGIIIAQIVGVFFNLPGLAMIVNVLGVLIFAGLTAYDTQRLKLTYYAIGGDQAGLSVATSYGAMTLYLDFVNLFLFLLRLFGSRR